MKKLLSLFIILVLSLLFLSCKNNNIEDNINYYEINFIASSGGTILGKTTQIVKEGNKTDPVKAIPLDGYEFDHWSYNDTRSDKIIIEDLKDNLTVTAFFKEIIYKYPEIFIITEGNKNITSKEEYLNCIITVSDEKDPEYNLNNIEAKIKGRGNSTWGMPKKPYRIKFNEKVDLFGNGKNKDWTLIANYCDPSLIRNYLAYSIASKFDDLPYTTSFKYAELYINGEYQGLYLVCEQIEAGKNRVDIDDKIGLELSFLVELDYRILDENKKEGLDYFYISNQPYGIKSPKTDKEGFTEEECKRIKDYLNFCLNTIKNKKYEDIVNYIDVNSFADGYIIHELFSSIDVNFSSWYMCKDNGGKLTNAPIWDFDISAGNVDYNDQARFPDRLFAVNNTWYKYLLRHDEFKKLVSEKLNKYYDMIKYIIDLEIENVLIYKVKYMNRI